MRIVHIASELAPVAKVGGLGDVIHGLSKSLLGKGHDVKVILPKYRSKKIPDVVDGISVQLIDIEGDQIYGYPNDAMRFATFTRKAVDLVGPYDVLHLHDWPTAIAAAFMPRTVLTIHNLAYSGHCGRIVLDHIGLQDVEPLRDGDAFSLLRGGIHFADQVTTVSPTYAKEIHSHPYIKPNWHKVSGILNGIDVGVWNPETDPMLPCHFSSINLEGKKKIQAHVRKLLKMEDGSPIVGVITRLVPQKNPELIQAALTKTRELGGQFILLGSASDPKIQAEFDALKREYASDRHVHLELSYNEELSHLIFAASDLFIVPSLFEPCGLTQMIAMRYGAVPLVRKTGGLADTIFEKKNGFLFKELTSKALGKSLEHAFDLFNNQPATFHLLQKAGMQEDLSWERSTNYYLDVYRHVSTLNATGPARP